MPVRIPKIIYLHVTVLLDTMRATMGKAAATIDKATFKNEQLELAYAFVESRELIDWFADRGMAEKKMKSHLSAVVRIEDGGGSDDEIVNNANILLGLPHDISRLSEEERIRMNMRLSLPPDISELSEEEVIRLIIRLSLPPDISELSKKLMTRMRDTIFWLGTELASLKDEKKDWEEEEKLEAMKKPMSERAKTWLSENTTVGRAKKKAEAERKKEEEAMRAQNRPYVQAALGLNPTNETAVLKAEKDALKKAKALIKEQLINPTWRPSDSKESRTY